ncbi:M91 family zinc metallopeptidase [Pokkaliibacter sp. MBI-7]|uniref:M91 family zinc metallopeptidase n=1 Tax=Pokkaliibacter sp. MBI-7 TaxID=3040600 RepID=UPI0024474ED1|nr:M91 family zinc metallopeptidase [Pokkaliibacter sp. MBI-7]MDH2434860.1 M91 family zinc metallopeptidase [Pokkaliibacter sp. MBI-7]
MVTTNPAAPTVHVASTSAADTSEMAHPAPDVVAVSPFPGPSAPSAAATLKAVGETARPAFIPTSRQLQDQRDELLPMQTVRSPFSPNIAIIRDDKHTTHTSGAEFADFATQTRQHLTQLAETRAGQALFHALDVKADGSKIENPVFIRDAGRQTGLRQGESASRVLATARVEEEAGHRTYLPAAGAMSFVSHHTDLSLRWGDPQQFHPELNLSMKRLDSSMGMSEALALGHELIHSAHSLNGVKVRGENEKGIPFEEINTVGPRSGRRVFEHIPTENEIRRDMHREVYNDAGAIGDIRPRKTYGGRRLPE